MLRTIRIGQYQSVQGHFVRSSPCGRIVVRVGTQRFIGFPVTR